MAIWKVIGAGIGFIGKKAVDFLTGGSLDGLLNTINRGMDSTTERERIKAEVTMRWVDRQADLLVGRTWWFQIFFVLPLGFWWSAVILDSVFGWEHNIAALPGPLDEWAAWIIGALFLVDGSKAIFGGARK